MIGSQTSGNVQATAASVRPNVLARLAAFPRELAAEARAGAFSRASMRCLLAGVLAFGLLFAWAGVLMVVLLVLGIPMAILSQTAWVNSVLEGVLIIISLPGIAAGVIVLAATLGGTFLGFLGMLRNEGRRLIGFLGMMLNGGVLIFFLLVVLLAIGLAL
jgi:uncharacterized membrane protein (UPF0136 family)